MEPSSSADVLIVEDLSQQHLPARYLVAVLQRVGLCVRLVDLNDGMDAVVALAKRTMPRLIISSILFADRVREHLVLMTALREADVRAHLTMVGPLPTFASAELLAACHALDSILRGEAEASVVQLAASVDDAIRWQTVPGLAFRSNSVRSHTPRRVGGMGGHSRCPEPYPLTICTNPLPKSTADLDDLPFAARDDGIAWNMGYGFATVEASRGCYHACSFCLPCAFYREQGARYRLRSITNLVDEIETLHRQGARLFLFDDEEFLPRGRARQERVAALGDELDRRNLQIAFTIKCRADDVEESLFRRLREMGLLRVYIGIESGCQATLDLLNKRVTAQQNTDALMMLDALGIVADFRALLFHPWSTVQAIEAEIAFLRTVLPYLPTVLDFREVEVLLGTPLANRFHGEGRSLGDAWRVQYTIADPRAELLRRLCRLVFSPLDAYGKIQNAFTQAWYAFLLTRRFRPSSSDTEHACELKQATVRVNDEVLSVWREMLAFASTGDIYDANQVNARASVWAGRVNAVWAGTTG